MEKKQYIIPQTVMVELKARDNMLQASVELGTTFKSGDTVLSRRGSWDDEEDED